MNNPIELLYLTASFIAVLAMIPQIKRLVVTKQSDELSLGTWATWGCCQLISFAYALSLNVRAYIIVNLAWIVFYALMVLLIIKYRTRRNVIVMILDLMRRRKAANSWW